jgi:hypothetical protein
MQSSDFDLAYEGNSVDANFVKNILEEHAAQSFLKNDTMGQLFPLFVTHISLYPVKVYVFKADVEKAKRIIAEYTGKIS